MKTEYYLYLMAEMCLFWWIIFRGIDNCKINFNIFYCKHYFAIVLVIIVIFLYCNYKVVVKILEKDKDLNKDILYKLIGN